MRTTNLAAAMALSLAASLAGCGGEPEGEAPIGAVVRSERMDALNLAVVTDDSEVGTLVGTFVNQAGQADALTGVSVKTERGPVQAYLLDGDVSLPPNENVRLATDQRVGLSGVLPKGRFIEVTLQFEDSRTLSTLVPVEPPTGPYGDIVVPDAGEFPAA